jgi:Flp pilus assembly pilin Flp
MAQPELLNREPVSAEATSQHRQRGASLVEYALLVALIAVVAIAAVRALGTQVSQQFSQIGAAVN